MNSYMNSKWSWIEGTHKVRNGLLDQVSDEDLAYTPGGNNITLGALFREDGEIEHSYVQSLKEFKQDWTYRNTEEGLEGSASRLRAWFETLDAELKSVVEAFSDEDLSKTIDRGGFQVPADMQLDIYLQALLIFLGKFTIYWQAMGRTLPEDIKAFIG